MKSLVIVALLSSVAVAAPCPSNCTEWEGNCACDVAPFKAESVNVASDEKPRKEQQRQWETGEIKADMPVSLIHADAKLDADKVQADSEGKKAAGL